jgi:CCR4-NOT transcription complex subunit 2
MPRDILQAYAAKELHTRGWRFHKELRLWFSRDNTANGQQPQFVFFNSELWEKQLFTGNLPATGFMSDADMNFESTAPTAQPSSNPPNPSNAQQSS